MNIASPDHKANPFPFYGLRAESPVHRVILPNSNRRGSSLDMAVAPDALRWRRRLMLRGLESLPVEVVEWT